MTQTQTTRRYLFKACHRALSLGNERGCSVVIAETPTLTQLTRVYRFRLRVCVRARAHTCAPERLTSIQNSQVHNIPHAYCSAGRVATGGNEDTASSYKDFIPINQGRSSEKAVMVTSSAANTCCSPAVSWASLPLFPSHSEWFPLNHNNPKSAKTYQSLGKPCLQRASRMAFMALSNSS